MQTWTLGHLMSLLKLGAYSLLGSQNSLTLYSYLFVVIVLVKVVFRKTVVGD